MRAPSSRLEHERELVPLEHRLDRVQVIVASRRGTGSTPRGPRAPPSRSAAAAWRRPRRRTRSRACPTCEKSITVSDALARVGQQCLDLRAHRGARGARHEVGIELARQRLPQHGAHVDVDHHRGPPETRSGIVIWTCEPETGPASPAAGRRRPSSARSRSAPCRCARSACRPTSHVTSHAGKPLAAARVAEAAHAANHRLLQRLGVVPPVAAHAARARSPATAGSRCPRRTRRSPPRAGRAACATCTSAPPPSRRARRARRCSGTTSESVIAKPIVAFGVEVQLLREDRLRLLLDAPDDLVHVLALRDRRDLEQHARLAAAARFGTRPCRSNSSSA